MRTTLLTEMEKLVAMLAIESIGSSPSNQYIVTDKYGDRLTMEKYDYPSGGFAIYDLTNQEEMVRVKIIGDKMSVLIVYCEDKYDIQLGFGDNGEIVSGIINSYPFTGAEITVKEGWAECNAKIYQAEKVTLAKDRPANSVQNFPKAVEDFMRTIRGEQSN